MVHVFAGMKLGHYDLVHAESGSDLFVEEDGREITQINCLKIKCLIRPIAHRQTMTPHSCLINWDIIA